MKVSYRRGYAPSEGHTRADRGKGVFYNSVFFNAALFMIEYFCLEHPLLKDLSGRVRQCFLP